MFGPIRNALERNAASIPLPARRLINPLIEESAEELAYWRLQQLGFEPGGVIDIGAYRGEWTRKTRRLFSRAEWLMVEAQEGQEPLLGQVAAETGAKLAIAALSANAGEELTFYTMASGSSLLPELSDVARTEHKVITKTLDSVASQHLPDQTRLFVKIDVQGAEKLVLSGGGATLGRTEVLQLELPFLPYNGGAPSFLEMVAWLDERDFVPFDLAGAHRPDGITTTQIDLLFVRRESPLRPRELRLT